MKFWPANVAPDRYRAEPAELREGEAMTDSRAALQRIALAFLCSIQAMPGVAGRPTMEECLEGSDFIRNAALARDAGMGAETFIDRMRDDFLAIRAFPAELRWFVHDEGDEAFLAGQVHLVFEQPSDPEDHRLRFLRVCVDRMGNGDAQPT
jgi:hypothetical protein